MNFIICAGIRDQRENDCPLCFNIQSGVTEGEMANNTKTYIMRFIFSVPGPAERIQ